MICVKSFSSSLYCYDYYGDCSDICTRPAFATREISGNFPTVKERLISRELLQHIKEQSCV